MVTTYHMTASHEHRPVNLVLRKILRHADDAALNLETGPEQDKGLRIVRRMLASAITRTRYRTEPLQRKSAGLAAWENEGGASGGKEDRPIDLTGCRPAGERHD